MKWPFGRPADPDALPAQRVYERLQRVTLCPCSPAHRDAAGRFAPCPLTRPMYGRRALAHLMRDEAPVQPTTWAERLTRRRLTGA